MRFGNTKQFTQHQQPPPQNYYEAGNLPPISEEPYASNKHSPGVISMLNSFLKFHNL